MSILVEALNQLGKKLGIYERGGLNKTALEGVCYYRSLEPSPRKPLLYHAGILIMGQGRKVVYLDGRSYTYDEDHYLVLTVPLPLECQSFASPEAPVQGIYIEVDLNLLYELVHSFNAADRALPQDEGCAVGIAAVPLCDRMREASARLIRALCDPLEARALGRGIKTELLYHALCGAHGPALFALANHDSQQSRVSRVLHRFHTDYSAPLVVEDLAREVGMSASAFHRLFKQVTADSPLQYLKKVRLNRARNLLTLEGERVGVAADRVGYQSASQFSREFKRYFGLSPAEARNATLQLG